MTITSEESEAYCAFIKCRYRGLLEMSLANALRRHVAAEMRLEFDRGHSTCLNIIEPFKFACMCSDSRHNFQPNDWDRAAHEALKVKSNG